VVDFVDSCVLEGIVARYFLQLLKLFFVVEGVGCWLVSLEFHDFISERAPFGSEELALPALNVFSPVSVRYIFGSWNPSETGGHSINV